MAALLALGISQAEIARRLGISRPTVTYHCRNLGIEADARFTRRYSWDEVQAYYDEGHSVRECQEVFGFSTKCWYDAKERGEIVPRPQAMPIDELLSGRRARSHVKRRLMREGLLGDRCARCGISEWEGEKLSLELHHLNGVNDDNRLENLVLLCPNCHSLTETYSGRNRGRPEAA